MTGVEAIPNIEFWKKIPRYAIALSKAAYEKAHNIVVNMNLRRTLSNMSTETNFNSTKPAETSGF